MIKIESLEKINDSAKNFLSVIEKNKVIAFYGGMGAGKTTFIKALCKELKVIDYVTSPTFSIINEYQTEDGDCLYHFDFYRLNKPEEALDIGYEDYIYSGKFCFIEWPEKIEQLLPGDILKVNIEEIENGKRQVSFY